MSSLYPGRDERKKFPKTASTRAKDILEIIHADFVDKIFSSSLGGSNYFVVFTDDFSHYTTTYPIKTKNKVLKKSSTAIKGNIPEENDQVQVAKQTTSGSLVAEPGEPYSLILKKEQVWPQSNGMHFSEWKQ